MRAKADKDREAQREVWKRFIYQTGNQSGRALHSTLGAQPLLCLAASLLSLSSAIVRRIPFPRGREIQGLLP